MEMTPDDIKQLQKDLAQYGWYTGRIDGRPGPKTDTAIAHFEKHFAPDLKLGAAKTSEASLVAVFQRIKETRELQHALSENGADIVIDGIMGNKTRAAAMNQLGVSEENLSELTLSDMRVKLNAPKQVQSETDTTTTVGVDAQSVKGDEAEMLPESVRQEAREAVISFVRKGDNTVAVSALPQSKVMPRMPRDGRAVSFAQQVLTELGLNDKDGNALKVDGDFGAKTRHAMNEFQLNNGLEVTRGLNEETLQKLYLQAGEAERTKVDETYLQDKTTIKQAQFMLSRSGFDVGGSDGVVGSKTIAALNAFRGANELPTSDSLDMATLTALTQQFSKQEGYAVDALHAVWEKGMVVGPADVSDLTIEARKALAELNYLSVEDATEFSGKRTMDHETFTALREFQKDHGLKQDGIIGPKTFSVLSKELSKEPLERRYATSPVDYKPPRITHTPEPLFGGSLSRRDENLLIALIWDEARGEGEKGRQLVAESIDSRMKHDLFPDTVRGVIKHVNEKGMRQYSGSHRLLSVGQIERRAKAEGIPDFVSDTRAMLRGLADGTIPAVSGGSIYFANEKTANSGNVRWMRTQGVVGEFGNHTLYGGDVAAHREGVRHWNNMRHAVTTLAGDAISLPQIHDMGVDVAGQRQEQLPNVSGKGEQNNAALSTDVRDAAREAANGVNAQSGQDEKQVAQYIPDARASSVTRIS